MEIRILEIPVSASVLLTAAHYLQDFSDDMVMFMKMFVVFFFNSMWWNVSVFEDLHNSEPVFSKWPMRDITKSCLVRTPSQGLARPMDLNVTEIILTRFFIPVYCNQLSSFGVVWKESIHIYKKRLSKIFLLSVWLSVTFSLLCIIHFSMLCSV